MAKIEENQIEDSNFRKTNGLSNTEDTLKSIEKQHSQHSMFQRTYIHMIQRMKADHIAAQIKQNEMQESYKSKKSIWEDEADKHRQAKQQRLQA